MIYQIKKYLLFGNSIKYQANILIVKSLIMVSYMLLQLNLFLNYLNLGMTLVWEKIRYYFHLFFGIMQLMKTHILLILLHLT